MKETLVGYFACAALLALALQQTAAARSLSAFSGKSRRGSDTECFSQHGENPDFPQSVWSSCNADFIVPLTTDASGTKSLTFTGRAGAAGAQCRAVASDRFGDNVSASAFRSIPVTDYYDYESRTTADVAVPSMGTFFADCIMNVDSELVEFDYSP